MCSRYDLNSPAFSVGAGAADDVGRGRLRRPLLLSSPMAFSFFMPLLLQQQCFKRVVHDILACQVQILFVANDMLIVISLPEMLCRHLPLHSQVFKGCSRC